MTDDIHLYAQPTRDQRERVLLAKLAAANERVATLEAVLRGLVDDSNAHDHLHNCKYCRHYIPLYEHAQDCPVVMARKLLEKPE